MAKKQKDTSIEAVILNPEDSVKLTLSHAWHYSFDADKATDAERTWIGPFATREEVDAAMQNAIETAAAKAAEIALFGDK